jgi:hypothetical protein
MAVTVALVTRRLLRASGGPLGAARPALAVGGDVFWSASVGALVVYVSFYLTVGGTGPERAPLLALAAAVLLVILLVAARIGRFPGGRWDRRLRIARERRGF